MSQSQRDDFIKAINQAKLDSSEFILLGVGLLKDVLSDFTDKNTLAIALNEIEQSYMNLIYNEAIEKMLMLVATHVEGVGPSLSTLFFDKAKELTDNPIENYSRRYFETYLAKVVTKESQASQAYKSLGKLVPFITTDKFEVNTPEDANFLISAISNFNDDIELPLKKQSKNYAHKDRADKEQGTSYSRNLGIMKSSQPNFYDQINAGACENRIPDKFRLDPQKTGYSTLNKAVPLTASISGTTYTLVTLLEDYMSSNKTDPNLQTDVNNIIKEFLHYYVTNGYHSYQEMTDVLIEPHIQMIFAAHNVELDLEIPRKMLETAFESAQEYALRTCLKRVMNDQIESSVKKVPPIEPTVTKKQAAKKQPLTTPMVEIFPEILKIPFMKLNQPSDRNRRTNFIESYFKLSMAGRDQILQKYQTSNDIMILLASLNSRLNKHDYKPEWNLENEIKRINDKQKLPTGMFVSTTVNNNNNAFNAVDPNIPNPSKK